MTKTIIGLLMCASVLSPSVLDTWREGFMEAYTLAPKFNSWVALWDWAETESTKVVIPLRTSRSTDLIGGRHTYTDTRAAGMRDACIGILAEMRFISRHNSGGTDQFFRIMQEYLKDQDPSKIIPLGHF